jgi:hypothetical protein
MPSPSAKTRRSAALVAVKISSEKENYAQIVANHDQLED